MSHPAFDPLDMLLLPTGSAQHLRHSASGAQLVVLEDGRRESCLSISFATTPPDDSGVAHVLEHLIFRGSRRFPEDQLYTALRTGSLASHLNAATRPAVTSYQLASPVPGDLLRSEAILLDAVFHPLLGAEAFAQEGFGWKDGRPSGVVFHEMTGHLARPEARLEQALRRALFPGSAQGRCHGGEPMALAGLTLDRVRAFHRNFYRPDNALVILTGSAGLDARLAGLDAALCAARRPAPQAVAEPQAETVEAVRVALGPRGPAALGWLLPELPLAQGVVLAAILRRAAGPGLWPESGLVRDGQRTYLQLLAPDPLRLCTATLAEELSAPKVQDALCAAVLHALDETADFRLPAGLQARPGLLGAWLRGGDLLAPLALPGALEAAARQPAALGAALRRALRALAPMTEVVLPIEGPEFTALPPPRSEPPPPEPGSSENGGAAARAEGPRWSLPPLTLRDLPRRPPETVCATQDGVLLLPDLRDGLLRICLGFSLAGLPEALLRQRAKLAAALRQALAHAGAEITNVPGPQFPLLITLKCPEPDLAPMLARLGGLLGQPLAPVGKVPEQAPHLALADVLREMFWRGAAGPSEAGAERVAEFPAAYTASRLTLACNRASALRELSAFRHALPEGAAPGRAGAAASFAGSALLELPRPGLSLPLAGRAGDLRGLPPALGWLSLRVIEHGWLWPRLRVAGGAYGLRIGLDGAGIATMVTAQDPAPLVSLAVMAAAGAWLAESAGPALLQLGQIAAVGQIFAPVPPDLRLQQAVLARMAGGPPSGWRSADLDAVLACGVSDLRALGAEIGRAFATGPAAVMGDAGRLAALRPPPAR